METSDAVNAAIDSSVELSEWITNNHPRSFTDAGNNKLAVAFFSIAIEHREAILCLLRHGARTSAFALARSVYEAGIKGSWAQYCATQEEHDRAFTTGVLPSLDTMIRTLGKVKAMRNVFSRSKQIAWNGLSDYAHGGMKQVIRWIGAEGVAPQHSDIEVQELMYFLDMHCLLACIGIVSIAGGSTDLHAAKALEVAETAREWKARSRQQTS